MDTLERIVDRRPPVSPQTSCAELAARFRAEHDALALAVTEDGVPVGLVPRQPFLARMQAAAGADDARPVREVMDADPLVASAATPAAAFRDQAIAERPADLLRGFIAVEHGRYLGVGTAISLLAARKGKARAVRDAAAAFGEKINREILRQLDGVADLTGRLARQALAADAQAVVRAIAETSEDLRRLVDQTSDIYRADMGLLSLDPRPRRLQEVMDGVDARWRNRAGGAGVTLLVSYEGDPDHAADIDAERLTQLFDCLISRAIAETRRGVVEASLKTRQVASGLALEGRVRDSGRSLPAGQLAHIFDAMRGEDVDGAELSTRLGMALSNRIIQAMAGVIRAEGNVGAGVTVTFDLIAPEAKAAAEKDEGPARAAHILIVDDNATNRMVAEALCEMFDCTSEQAVDGIEALEAVHARAFDLILMDIKMPRMDGLAATKAIRALPGRVGMTPIIALTANADPEDVRGYLAAGMNDVVEKPIKPDRLLAALDAAMPVEEGKTAAA